MPKGAPLGVAVSGGGDSTALLHLAAAWGRETGHPVHAITVDHALRPESAAEAAGIARQAAALGLPHSIRRWEEGPGPGNLQAAAREVRRALIAAWAEGAGIAHVALGHTADDQAETFLMNLARGSGIDGLAAMAPVTEAGGLTWHRPLLTLRRVALRDYLRAEGVRWIEDPSNADPRFDRVRMRAALPALAELGLDVERLTATTGAMARARDALEEMTRECAARALTVDATGAATLASVAAAEELRLRLLAAVLQLVSGARYRPRLADLERLAAAWAAGDLGGGRTLHGCLIRPEGPALRILREPAAVAPPGRADALWDRRWRIAGAPPGATLGALGAEAGDAALATTPALRAPDGTLLAAPVAQPDGRVTATFDPPDPLGLLPKPR